MAESTTVTCGGLRGSAWACSGLRCWGLLLCGPCCRKCAAAEPTWLSKHMATSTAITKANSLGSPTAQPTVNKNCETLEREAAGPQYAARTATVAATFNCSSWALSLRTRKSGVVYQSHVCREMVTFGNTRAPTNGHAWKAQLRSSTLDAGGFWFEPNRMSSNMPVCQPI